MIAAVGDRGGETRGWTCTRLSSAASFACDPSYALEGFDSVAVAVMAGFPAPLFVRADEPLAGGNAFRPGESISMHFDTTHIARMSGTDGPVVHAPLVQGDTWVYLLGAGSGFQRNQMGAAGPRSSFERIYLQDPDEFAPQRAQRAAETVAISGSILFPLCGPLPLRPSAVRKPEYAGFSG